jgi:hypothetical protein
MKTLGPYDATLEMFVREPRDADPRYLRFLRWLAEHGELEHGVAGSPTGPHQSSIGEGSGDGRLPAECLTEPY